MPSLREVQQRVLHALTLRDDGWAAVQLLRPAGELSPQRRLQVYRNNFFEIRIAALAAVYPVVERLVGSPFFRHAARAYIQLFPSRSADLRAFGDGWPQFLREYVPAASLPYLGDVAALEWAYHYAYHGSELPPLNATWLARLAPTDQAELQLRLQPSASVIRSPYPVLRIWQANQPDAPDADVAIHLHEGGAMLLVVQRELEVEFRTLGHGEGLWLCALGDDFTLVEATQQALDRDPCFDVAAALSRHLADGLFVEASLPQT